MSSRSFIPAFTLLLAFAACRSGDALPDPESEAYQETVTAFYTGIASMQAGNDAAAEEEWKRAAGLAPGEPAIHANLGVLALRQSRYEDAQAWLNRAHELAPDNSQIETILATLYSNQGQFDEAIAHLRRAVELDPTNLKATYALAQALERQGGEEANAEVIRLVNAMLRVEPANTALLLEKIRLAARTGDTNEVAAATARLARLAPSWPEDVQAQFTTLQASIQDGNVSQAGTQVAFLRNSLPQVAAYRRDLQNLQAPEGQAGELFTDFVHLPSAGGGPAPAPSDMTLTFTAEPVENVTGSGWTWAGAMWPGADTGPVAVLAGPQRLALGGQSLPAPPISPAGAGAVDYNNDFRSDLLLAGPGGLRLYRQDILGAFTDVTASLNLPASISGGSYTGAWIADIDLEGDLDIVLAPTTGAPVVLRNNGDDTFAVQQPFPNVSAVRAFTWTDLDADGDPDAALVDESGTLYVFLNERMAQFRSISVQSVPSPLIALASTDLNSDSVMDLVALGSDGAVRLLTLGEGEAWSVADIAQAQRTPGETPRLLTADLDNNGGLDLIVSGATTRIWLRGADGTFEPLDASLNAAVFDVADMNTDGRQDLIGLGAEGQPVRLISSGEAGYNWQVIRPRAALALGDQRVNTFGIGGEIEVRSGLFFQKQPIRVPSVHFGLGEHDGADVARIIWPNGDPQAEFDLVANQAILTPQRLKGSCPWLFTYDGEEMQFVTDFIWRSPLGLAINAQETAGVMMTEDRVRIRGDQLRPRDGFYDLRITAELWETHFFDHVSLLVVDHPEGTELFIDERFVFPPPDLSAQITSPVQPVTGARDEIGRDVSSMVTSRDGQYLDTFGPGDYQGITKDHYVELALPDDVPATGLRLIGFGWLRPTDSSINVAISQGAHAPPTSLSLEVPDGNGGWAVAQADLGFPAGKLKTVVLNLDGIFKPGAPKRLRLRTNLEIYWDHLGWAVARPKAETRSVRLAPHTADLQYRGFSRLVIPNRSSPETPVYEIEGTAPRWRDLIGYHTRFGDVRELLETVDDRYVIMNAGDEMRFLFDEQPAPPEGWVRDFVLIGDGWEKDGDYNTAFSKTVLPLPLHDRPDYSTPPGRLQDDPAYQRNPQDWQTYHTRYITPEPFHHALRPER